MKKLFLILPFSFLLLPFFVLANQFNFLPTVTTTALPQQKSYSPNNLHVEQFINAVAKVNKNNPQLQAIEAKIRKDAATTTDLVTLFFKQNQSSFKSLFRQGVPKKSLFSMFGSFLVSMFTPQKALASIGLPFGGPLVFDWYCDCSDAWLLFIGPTANPLTSDMVLTYETGSQAFASYNIPLATEVLGTYIPAVPACFEYIGYGCIPIESEGLVTPEVGSNLL